MKNPFKYGILTTIITTLIPYSSESNCKLKKHRIICRLFAENNVEKEYKIILVILVIRGVLMRWKTKSCLSLSLLSSSSPFCMEKEPFERTKCIEPLEPLRSSIEPSNGPHKRSPKSPNVNEVVKKQ